MEQHTEQQELEARAKYVRAFNDTMIKIWKGAAAVQLTALGYYFQ